MNQLRQDYRITKQYMNYKVELNPNRIGLIDFREGPSLTQLENMFNLYIFKILTPYQRLNFREMIANPQMI